MYKYNYKTNSEYKIVIFIITIIIIIIMIYGINKKKIEIIHEYEYEYEDEQIALEENKKNFNEITIKELKIKQIQDILYDNIINETLLTQINKPSLSEEEISNLLINEFPECEYEIKSNIQKNNINIENMLKCFTDIADKKKLLAGNEECLIELSELSSNIDININEINLKEIDIEDIIKCIQNKNVQQQIQNELEKQHNEQVEQIFEESIKQDNYANNEYITSRGIKYKVGALQQASNIFWTNTGEQTTATKCGNSQISVGYDITITHPDNINETTICIYESGIIDNNNVYQMNKKNDNTWYIFINKDNKCDDWGIYIPHSGYDIELEKLENTGNFKFFNAYDLSQRIYIKDESNNTKYIVYYNKDYCEMVNQKIYTRWYYWNKNKNTTSCKNYNQYCCDLYTQGNYELNAKDTEDLQFIRTINYKPNKIKDTSKINLYETESVCNDDNYVIDSYKYDVYTNKCINRNNKIDINEMKRLNKETDKFDDIYMTEGGCQAYIKNKYYVYTFNEITKRNKCIELISDKCNTYGDPTLCNSHELREWANINNTDHNKIFRNLNECQDKFEHNTYYYFDNNKCHSKKLRHGEERELRDSSGFIYYSSENECEIDNFKYWAFDIEACHTIQQKTFNDIENQVILRKKDGIPYEFKRYVKILNSADSDKYGINNTVSLFPDYNTDYNRALSKCFNEKSKMDKILNPNRW